MFFLKSGVHADHARWTPAGSPGIFAGYKLSYGYAFRGEYLVWPIDTFDEIDLRVTSTWLDQGDKTKNPISTAVIRLPADGVRFPLKENYDKCNHGIDWLGEMLAGRNSPENEGEVVFPHPQHPAPDEPEEAQAPDAP